MTEQKIQTHRVSGQPAQQGTPLPDLSNLQLDGETLRQMQVDSERAKKRSGILLIFFLLVLVIAVNVLNSLFFRNADITKYSVIGFIIFFVPILFTKFDLLKIIVDKWFPYLQEPEDFLKRVKG